MRFFETLNTEFINIEEIKNFTMDMKKVRNSGYYCGKYEMKDGKVGEFVELPCRWVVKGQTIQLDQNLILKYLEIAIKNLCEAKENSVLIYEYLVEMSNIDFTNHLIKLMNEQEEKELKKKKEEEKKASEQKE